MQFLRSVNFLYVEFNFRRLIQLSQSFFGMSVESIMPISPSTPPTSHPSTLSSTPHELDSLIPSNTRHIACCEGISCYKSEGAISASEMCENTPENISSDPIASPSPPPPSSSSVSHSVVYPSYPVNHYVELNENSPQSKTNELPEMLTAAVPSSATLPLNYSTSKNADIPTEQTTLSSTISCEPPKPSFVPNESSSINSSSNVDANVKEKRKSSDELAEVAKAFRLEGNKLFGDHMFLLAQCKYTEAIDRLEELISIMFFEELERRQTHSDFNNGDSFNSIYSQGDELRNCIAKHLSAHLFYVNRAQCHIKLESYASAIVDTTLAIQYHENFSKAYYHRGVANLCLNRLSMALKDFERSYCLNPIKDIKLQFERCRRALKASRLAAAIHTDRTELIPLSQRLDLSKIVTPSNYTGPVYESDTSSSPELLAEVCEYLKTPGNVLSIKAVCMIILDMIKILSKLPNIVKINVPEDEIFTICGDLHGQFYDLLNIFDLNGKPSQENPFLFNGDFVDRGAFSVECVLTLFLAKLTFPNHVHLSRGNHETINMNSIYGFKGEVTSKYNETVYNLFTECFRLLPLGHIINEKIIVVHGGLFSSDDVLLEDIYKLDRNCEPRDEGIMVELLWSDPQVQNGRSPSQRGVACRFGPDVTSNFLKKNNLSLLIRSHEMKQDGYEVEHDGNLITVFSAPNYCDTMRNKGAFLKLKGSNILDIDFVTFSEVEHPPCNSMQDAYDCFKII